MVVLFCSFVCGMDRLVGGRSCGHNQGVCLTPTERIDPVQVLVLVLGMSAVFLHFTLRQDVADTPSWLPWRCLLSALALVSGSAKPAFRRQVLFDEMCRTGCRGCLVET